MPDQVEQLKQLGFSAAAIGLGEEYDKDEKAAREGKFEIVFGSPETWISSSWRMVNLVGRQLHLQSMKVNKIDRPSTTPTVHGICTFAVFFFDLSAFLSLHSCL